MLLLKIMIPRVFIFVCDISQCMGCVCVGGGGGGGGGGAGGRRRHYLTSSEHL